MATVVHETDSEIFICQVTVFDHPFTKVRELSKHQCSRKTPITDVSTPAKVDTSNFKEITNFIISRLSSNKKPESLLLTKIVRAFETQVIFATVYEMVVELTSQFYVVDLNTITAEFHISCEVVVYDRPWAKKRELKLSTCSPIEIEKTTIKPKTTTTTEATTTTTTKPTTTTPPPYLLAKPDDEDVRKIAIYAVWNLSSTTKNVLGFYGSFKLYEIIEAKIQHAYNSTNYQMILEITTLHGRKDSASFRCEVTVFDQPWNGTRTLSEWKCSSTKTRKSVCKARTPNPDGTPDSVVDPIPPSMMTGSYSPVDVDDTNVKEIADFATTSISLNINMGQLSLVRITAAETQIVAGTNYKLTLELLNDADSSRFTCEVIVFDQPWTKTRSLSHSTCSTAGGTIREKSEKFD